MELTLLLSTETRITIQRPVLCLRKRTASETGENQCGGASGLFAETGGRGIDKRPIFGRTGLRASAGDRSGVPGI